MVAVAKKHEVHIAPSPTDVHRRREAVRQGVASVVIEGGQVTADTEAWLDDWATGTLTEEEVIANLRQVYGRGP